MAILTPGAIQAPVPTPDDPLITAGQLATMASGVSQMTLWRWIRDGIIPQPILIRGRRYWVRSVVTAALMRRAAA